MASPSDGSQIYVLWLSNWDSTDGVVAATLDAAQAMKMWQNSLLVGGLCGEDERHMRCHGSLRRHCAPYDSEGKVECSFADLRWDGHYVSLLMRFPSKERPDVGSEVFVIWTSERSKKWFERGGVMALSMNAKEAVKKAFGICFLLCGRKPMPNVNYTTKQANDFAFGGEYFQIALQGGQNLVVQRCVLTSEDLTSAELIEPIRLRKCGPYNGHILQGCVPLFTRDDKPEWKITLERLKQISRCMITFVLCLKMSDLPRPLRIMIARQAYQDRVETMWEFE
jgi:hypothetical protein